MAICNCFLLYSIPFLYLQNSGVWLNRPHTSHALVFPFLLTLLDSLEDNILIASVFSGISSFVFKETSDGVMSDG